MNDRSRFSCSQKIHQLRILRIALKKKLKAIYKFQKYRQCKIGLVLVRTDKSVYEHDAEYQLEEQVTVNAQVSQNKTDFRLCLDRERSRKQMEVKE